RGPSGTEVPPEFFPRTSRGWPIFTNDWPPMLFAALRILRKDSLRSPERRAASMALFTSLYQNSRTRCPLLLCRTAVSLHRPRAALSNGGGFLFAQGKNGIL